MRDEYNEHVATPNVAQLTAPPPRRRSRAPSLGALGGLGPLEALHEGASRPASREEGGDRGRPRPPAVLALERLATAPHASLKALHPASRLGTPLVGGASLAAWGGAAFTIDLGPASRGPTPGPALSRLASPRAAARGARPLTTPVLTASIVPLPGGPSGRKAGS